MKATFKVEILKFNKIHNLPGAWAEGQYKDLLELMDYDDVGSIPASDLKEMCYLSLTDNEPEESAELVMGYLFKDRLNAGQLQNLSNEMIEEKLWEEYADIAMHEEMFNAGQLLYEAYNGKFPHPEAIRFQVKITAKNAGDLKMFSEDAEAPLIRLLVQGMAKNTLINRLFDEQLEGETFTDAKDIIWQLKQAKEGDKTIVFDVLSSYYWFEDIKYFEDFEGETHTDSDEDEADL